MVYSDRAGRHSNVHHRHALYRDGHLEPMPVDQEPPEPRTR